MPFKQLTGPISRAKLPRLALCSGKPMKLLQAIFAAQFLTQLLVPAVFVNNPTRQNGLSFD